MTGYDCICYSSGWLLQRCSSHEYKIPVDSSPHTIQDARRFIHVYPRNISCPEGYSISYRHNGYHGWESWVETVWKSKNWVFNSSQEFESMTNWMPAHVCIPNSNNLRTKPFVDKICIETERERERVPSISYIFISVRILMPLFSTHWAI